MGRRCESCGKTLKRGAYFVFLDEQSVTTAYMSARNRVTSRISALLRVVVGICQETEEGWKDMINLVRVGRSQISEIDRERLLLVCVLWIMDNMI